MKARTDARSVHLRAIAWMVLSTVAFSAMHALVRHITQEIHVFEVAFFRNFFGVIALLPLFLRYGLTPLKTDRLGMLSFRAVINTGAMFAYFYGLSVSPLAAVSALGFSAPIFATLLAILFLGEVVRVRRWVAIFIGFAGALTIIRPGVIEFDPGMLSVLTSSVLWAGALVVIKSLSKTESSLTITAYMGILMAPLSLIPAIFVWDWPTLEQLGWMAAIGVLGTVGQYTMTEALHMGDTSEVMPLDFLKLIWAALFGFLAFGETPDVFTWIGGVTIFAAATYIALREADLGNGRGRS